MQLPSALLVQEVPELNGGEERQVRCVPASAQAKMCWRPFCGFKFKYVSPARGSRIQLFLRSSKVLPSTPTSELWAYTSNLKRPKKVIQVTTAIKILILCPILLLNTHEF